MANNQKIAEEMCKYYFYQYYITHKYDDDSMMKSTSYEERIKLFNQNYFLVKYPDRPTFKTRNFKYFLKAAEMFSDKEEFEPKTFIDAIMAESFLMPAQIPQNKNWKIFLRNSQETEVVEDLQLNCAKKVKSFFTFLNGRKIKDIIGNLILRQDWIDAYAEDKLDLSVLCFSKSFMEFANKENMMIDFSEEQSKISEKIKNKIKEKIGDDFMEV